MKNILVLLLLFFASGIFALNKSFPIVDQADYSLHVEALQIEKIVCWKGTELGWHLPDPNGAGTLKAVSGTLEGSSLYHAFPFKSSTQKHSELDSLEINLLERMDVYDIVVYGGTSGGVIAAVQAARMGKTVALIEPGLHLGGLTSGGLGFVDVGKPETIGGLAREYFHRVWKYYQDDTAWKWEKKHEMPGQHAPLAPQDETMWIVEPSLAERLFDQMATEANVDDRAQRAAKSREWRDKRRTENRQHYHGIRPRFSSQDVYRRNLRRRSDGRIRCIVFRWTRTQQPVQRNAQRDHADADTRQFAGHRPLSNQGKSEERTVAPHSSRLGRKDWRWRPRCTSLHLPDVPHTDY